MATELDPADLFLSLHARAHAALAPRPIDPELAAELAELAADAVARARGEVQS